MYRSILVVFFTAYIIGCGANGGSSESAVENVNQTTEGTAKIGSLEAAIVEVDSQGIALHIFQVPSNVNKLGITSIAPAILATGLVLNDSDVVYLDASKELLASGMLLTPGISTVNIPSRDFDPALLGGSYAVAVFAFNPDASLAFGAPVLFNLITNEDSNLSQGSLQVNVIYLGVLSETPAAIETVRQTFDTVKAIWAQAGIALLIAEFTSGGPNVLPLPISGSNLYGNISSQTPQGVNICIGADIELSSSGLLGISPAIPGPPIATNTSCIVVGLLGAAGPDGVFSAEDLIVLATTLAHEMGHYAGLFHPIGFEGLQDPLPDTPACASVFECLGELGNNLMFPTAISLGDGTFVRQTVLTPQQVGVLNRNVLVN